MSDLSPSEQAGVEYENLRLEALRDFDRADTAYELEQCQRRLDELVRAEEKRADDIADERARTAEREADFDRRQREILAGEYAGTK